jgi:hypothetical protein
MILSQEGRAKLLELQTGFFLDRALVGPQTLEVQIIVKAPHEIIGAVLHGAKMFLWTGVAGPKGQGILAATFTVEDDPDASFYLSRALCSEQAQLLNAFFADRRGHVIFFNELNRGLLTLQVSIAEQPYLVRAMALLSGVVGELNGKQIDAALDDIEARAARKPKFLKSIYLLSGDARPNIYEVSSLGFAPPPRGAERYSRVTHLYQEAGSKLEERIAQILRRSFRPEAILVSPWLRQEQRELCDVLVGSRWGYLFVESKAMAVNIAALGRRTERRLAGFKKQIEKALKQLEGVRRRVLSPEFRPVETGLGVREIESYRHELLHFGVVMSEVHPDLAKLEAFWEQAIASAEASETALHLLDANELLTLTNLSRSEEEFFVKLKERWEVARERRTLVLNIVPQKL